MLLQRAAFIVFMEIWKYGTMMQKMFSSISSLAKGDDEERIAYDQTAATSLFYYCHYLLNTLSMRKEMERRTHRYSLRIEKCDRISFLVVDIIGDCY